MDTSALKNDSRSLRESACFWVVTIAFAGALVLTVLSWLELCTQTCVEGHKYALYGLKFEPVGMIIFSSALVIHLLSRESPRLKVLIAWMVAGSLGAEVWFIYAQHSIIGKWCPLCLGIAACIGVAALAMMYQHVENVKNKIKDEDRKMHTLRGLPSIGMMVLGFFIAFMGFAKENPLLAAQASFKDSIAFGNQKSPIEVYVFTDWFCPACRMVEPALEKMAPAVEAKAKLFFVDMQVHDNSLNFTPYNLAFMVNNKSKYFALRKALNELALKNKSPTEKQVQEAISPLGVKLRELSFTDISLGVKLFKSLGKQFNIEATPTVVIINVENKKGKKLSGAAEITEENMMKAIDSLK